MSEYFSHIAFFLVFAILAALAWRDHKEYILPNYLNAALALSFAAFHIVNGWQYLTPIEAILGAAICGALLLAIRALANHLYKTDALGLGDVKLMAAAGLGLGFGDVMMALTLGASFGLLHGFILAIASKRQVPLGQVNVPAGVGLALGIAIVWAMRYGGAL